MGVWGLPALAQVEAGLGVTPDGGMFSPLDPSTAAVAARTPLALALSLAFDSTTWAAVGVSTAAPAGEVAEFLARGYYRLEILQLTLLAQASGKRLLDLRTRRTKDALTLRQLAEEVMVPYDEILDRAELLARSVDERVKDLDQVGALAPPGKER